RIAVPAEALRVAHTQGVDLAQRAVVTDERIVGRDTVLAVRAARAERVDAQDLAERGTPLLREVQRITAAAAVRRTDVEQTEVRITGPRVRPEGDVAAVVVAKRLFEAHQHARCTAIVRRGIRILGAPLEQHRVVRRLAAAREETGGDAETDVNGGVQAAVPRCPGLGKLRIQRIALEALLPATRLDVEAPARVVDTEVERCGS